MVSYVFSVCSFSGLGPVAAWFEGPCFVRVVGAADQVRSEEAWLACAVCVRLVENEDREGLVDRYMSRQHRKDKQYGRTRDRAEWSAMRSIAADHLDASFWLPRSIATVAPSAMPV
jgi:hypothetical protein